MTIYQRKFILERMELGYFTIFKAVQLLWRWNYSWQWLDTDWHNDILWRRWRGWQERMDKSHGPGTLWGHCGDHHGYGFPLPFHHPCSFGDYYGIGYHIQKLSRCRGEEIYDRWIAMWDVRISPTDNLTWTIFLSLPICINNFYFLFSSFLTSQRIPREVQISDSNVFPFPGL